LREVLLGDPESPYFANLEGPGRIGHIRALDEHPFQDRHVLRGVGDVLGANWLHIGATNPVILILLLLLFILIN
jgi:hypothetical protein